MKLNPLFLILSLATSLRAMEGETAHNNDKPNYFDTLPREMINLIAECLAADPSTTLKDCNAFLRTCKRFNAVDRDAIINQNNALLIAERLPGKPYFSRRNYYALLMTYKSWRGNFTNQNDVIKRYVDEENRDNNQLLLIHGAADLGAIEWMKKTLDEHPELINARNFRRETPLHRVAGYHQSPNTIAIAQLLIDKKADIEACATYGENPLQHAIHYDDEAIDIAHLLIINGASMARTHNILHVAALNNNVAFAQLILSKGMDVNAREYFFERTPLHRAVQAGAYEMVAWLLDNGADVNALDHYDMPPIFYAAAYNKNTLIIQLLVDRGANIQVKGSLPPSFHSDPSSVIKDKVTLRDQARSRKNQPMIDFLEKLYATTKKAK